MSERHGMPKASEIRKTIRTSENIIKNKNNSEETIRIHKGLLPGLRDLLALAEREEAGY